MRVLVTGSNGLLGTKLLALLLAEHGVQPLGVSRAPSANAYLGPFPFWQADLADAAQVDRAFDAARPDLVLHTAGMTDVDGCERQPDEAWRLNVLATRHVAAAATRHRARLVHLSTEYVFDGTAGPYGEDEPPNPLSVYGRTKLESEAAAFELAPGSAVARTTVLFGHAPHVRPNFVTWLLDRLRAGQETTVVTDQVGSPTLADNLAEMVWAIGRDRTASGVFHTVGASVMDRYTFACLAARVFGLDERLVRPTLTSALRQAAPRPLRAGLRIDRFLGRYPLVQVLDARASLEQLRAQLAAEAGRDPITGTEYAAPQRG